MRIERKEFPGAIFPEDRVGPLCIEGAGNLVFSRNETAMYFDISAIKNIHASNWMFCGLTKKTRAGRFLQALPGLWRFSK